MTIVYTDAGSDFRRSGPAPLPPEDRTRGRRGRGALLAATILAVWVAAAMGGGCAPEGPFDPSADAPPAPEGFRATAVMADRVDLAWLQVRSMPVAEYRLYRDGTVVATVDDTVHSDRGLSPETSYSYQVSSVDGEGNEGPRSLTVSVQTQNGNGGGGGDATAPSTPTDLSAKAVAPSQIDLSWNPASDPESGIDRYEIYRDGDRIGSASGSSFSDTGLEPDTRYEYRVSAVNGAGLEGERSDEAAARTLEEEEPEDTSPPSAPGDLSADAVSESRIDLDWDAASDPESGIAHYRVYRDGSPVAQTGGTAYSDTGLEPDTRYEYRVSAVNGVGIEGERSKKADARTHEDEDTSPPSAPGDLSAEAVSESRIDLDWDAASDPESGIARYRVYRDGSRVAEPTGTSYSDTGLEPDTRYEYRVSAVNGAGLEGERSDQADARTLEEEEPEDTSPPSAPGDLDAEALSESTIRLEWRAASDPESGIARYRVYRDGTGEGDVVAQPSSTAFTDFGLEPDTRYSYRVSAVNGVGLEGERSERARARTHDDDDDDEEENS